MAKEYLQLNGKLLMTPDGELVQVPDDENLNNLADTNGIMATQNEEVTKEMEELIVNGVIDGSPRGVYASLSALQTAYPSGASGVYLTSDNGHWYYWNGSAWTDGGVYQTDLSYERVNYILSKYAKDINMRNGSLQNIYNANNISYSKVEEFNKSFIISYNGAFNEGDKIKFGLELYDDYNNDYGNVSNASVSWTNTHRLYNNEVEQYNENNSFYVDYDKYKKLYPSAKGIAISINRVNSSGTNIPIRITTIPYLIEDYCSYIMEQNKKLSSYLYKNSIPYLCFTFENTIGKLNILKSYDAKKFSELKTGIVIEKNSGYAFRDPTTIKYEDKWVMVSTRIVGNISDTTYETNNYFRVSVSEDLINWESKYVALPTNYSKVWSPTITKTKEGKYILVFTALTNGDIYSRRTYIANIDNMLNMTISNIRSITYGTTRQDYSDQGLFFANGYYYIVNTVVGKIHLFKSQTLEGTFNEVTMNNNWASRYSFLEGVQINRLEDKFIAYMVCPSSSDKGLYYSVSTDLINWTDLVKCGSEISEIENPYILGKNDEVYLSLYNAFNK